MKCALFIEDGLHQIILTPETDTEKRILKLFHEHETGIQVLRGAFYECVGGWVRQGHGNESTILVLRQPEDNDEQT